MKKLSLLVWVTQLGLSAAMPPVGCIFLAVWLHNRFGWGKWVIFTGIGLGLYMGITGFLSTLKAIKPLAEEKKEETPLVSFNDHS